MFDGIDARADSVFNGLRSMRVRRDFAPEFVGFLRDGLHLLERVLRRAGLIAFAQDSAGSANLDEVCAVLNRFANLGARRPRAVRHAFRFVMKFRWKEIVVAMTSGNPQWRTGHAHARPLDFAGINAIA